MSKDNTMAEKFCTLRESTGMNRKEFAEHLGIPYRTMQEWELGRRAMPDYVFSLIRYRVENEAKAPEQVKDKSSVIDKLNDRKDVALPKKDKRQKIKSKEAR